MSLNPENSVIFSLDNLRAMAGVNKGRRRLASLGPGDSTSFLNLPALNSLDSGPAALHAPGVLIAPTRQVANRWLFPALLSLGMLLLLFSGLAMAVVIKKQRAQQTPQALAVTVDATPKPTPPTTAALIPTPAQQRAKQVHSPAAEPQTQQPASATPRQELAKRKTSHQIAKAKRIRRDRRLARLRRQRRQRKLRRSHRRSGTRVAARSARKNGKKGQDLDALLLGF